MKRNAAEIKFGIEIECMIPSGVSIPVGGYHHGLSINFAPAGWNAQSDCSIHCPSGYKPVEIVSPPMRGEDGLAQVYYMVEMINELGGIVNDSCGLHVHVDANSMSESEVMAVRNAFLRYEMAFYGLSGTMACYRMTHYYSKSSRTASVGERYQGINLLNWLEPSPLRRRNNARTIEIRAWAGTTNPDEIITAVYMAVALVASGGSETASEIKYARDAARLFVNEVWAAPSNRIIPDESVEELAAILQQRCIDSRL